MICALVLAAGQSRRMGTQKLLLPWEGQPVIVHVVDELLRSPVDQIFVVIGEEGKQIREAIAGRRVHGKGRADPESLFVPLKSPAEPRRRRSYRQG